MSNDELKHEDADLDQEPSGDDGHDVEQTSDDERNPSSMRGSLISILLTLLIVGAGAYYWYQNSYLPQQQDLNAKITALSSEQMAVESSLATIDAGDGIDAAVESITAQNDALKTSLTARIESVADQAEKVAASQQQLQQSVTSLYEKEDQSSLDWVLAEAEYLVLAANQRLALEGDINTAIAALKAADQRLGSADHPDLIPIRDRIIEDAAALEAVKLPDIEGLAIYLAKVIAQVNDLPTKQVADTVQPLTSRRSMPPPMS